ncbi:cytochrome c-type biogenesis protein CcmH, partial [Vibrio furnissii]
MAAIDVYDFESPEQETQFQELSNTLRCPKCQNNSIADSNAELAKDLRHKVYEMTKEGKSKSEIVDYMIARYGNFVTYNPPFTLSTAILW